jgi:hypothetical protein
VSGDPGAAALDKQIKALSKKVGPVAVVPWG